MKTLCVFLVLCLLLTATGCFTVATPAVGWIFTDVKWPQGATSNTGCSKMGKSEAMSVLGWVATGDASIDTAAKNGGITKIHHVDYHSWSILGVYGKLTTTVYGE